MGFSRLLPRPRPRSQSDAPTVTDASVIAHSATGVVFVVGSEMTSKEAARTALERLDSAKAKYVGGILNRVNVHGDRYYYARHYRREYGDYYTKQETT